MELGPIQKEDAELLQAVIRMTKPMRLIEFGHQGGASARAMLEAMDNEASLVSYDPYTRTEIRDPRFIFKSRGQEQYEEVRADFVFFDGAHDLGLNVKTWIAVRPTLAPSAIIAIHDTGTWSEKHMENGGDTLEDGSYAHQPHERRFINWLAENYPTFHQINFHTHRAVRHGMTLLQEYKPLKEI